jgi:hypothetical protein
LNTQFGGGAGTNYQVSFELDGSNGVDEIISIFSIGVFLS